MKILAIQFKYFGDAVLMTPSLRALREHFPRAEIHLLVPEEIAPIFQHLPWLNRVWPMPRRRGSASLRQTWPVIRALRRERFDRSVDFASNDRGAILSFLAGAPQRLGWAERGGFLGRRFCYNQRVAPETKMQHESVRLAHLLSAWEIAASSLEAEIRSDPALAASAEKLLPPGQLFATSLPASRKKNGRCGTGLAFYRLAAATGRRVAFTTAVGAREQNLMAELKKILPDAPVLPVIPELPQFLAVLNRAEDVHFRRHRPAAFCRRPRRADSFAFWPQFRRAMGAVWPASSGLDRQPVRVRREFRRLPRPKPLPRRHHAGTGI
jgi:heptosyltransferase-3